LFKQNIFALPGFCTSYFVSAFHLNAVAQAEVSKDVSQALF
jgi:hypothetical protein